MPSTSHPHPSGKDSLKDGVATHAHLWWWGADAYSFFSPPTSSWPRCSGCSRAAPVLLQWSCMGCPGGRRTMGGFSFPASATLQLGALLAETQWWKQNANSLHPIAATVPGWHRHGSSLRAHFSPSCPPPWSCFSCGLQEASATQGARLSLWQWHTSSSFKPSSWPARDTWGWWVLWAGIRHYKKEPVCCCCFPWLSSAPLQPVSGAGRVELWSPPVPMSTRNSRGWERVPPSSPCLLLVVDVWGLGR